MTDLKYLYMAEFKPNIYPIMYWGLMYGLIAGFVLFLLFILSRYITLLWFPVFLVGVMWGGYRNYRKQKNEAGHAGTTPKSPIEEFKEAARDIVGATREMIAEQARETEQATPETEEATAETEASPAEEDLATAPVAVEGDNELVEQAPAETAVAPEPMSPVPSASSTTPPRADNSSTTDQTNLAANR